MRLKYLLGAAGVAGQGGAGAAGLIIIDEMY